MPAIQFLILATLAAIATTAVAAPGLPRVPIAIEDPWPTVVARAPASGIISLFPTPLFPPDMVVRSPRGPTIYLPPVKDVSGDIIARAPEDPKASLQFWDPTLIVARAPKTPTGEIRTGPPPFVGTWEELSTGDILARAPNPGPAPGVVTATAVTEATYTVDCGCWNICTLEKVVNKDVICPAVCDPQYQCGAIANVADLNATKRDNFATAMTERDMDSLTKRSGGASTSVELGPDGHVKSVTVTASITW